MLGDKTNLRAGVGDPLDTRNARIGLNPKFNVCHPEVFNAYINIQ